MLASDPLGYWRLGEVSGATAADESNTGVNGAHSGTALGVPGALPGDGDGAAGFDGARAHVALPNTQLPLGLTFEAWVKTTDQRTTPAYSGNAANTIVGDHRGIVWAGFGVQAGRLRYNHHTWMWNDVAGGVPVADGAWHHVAVTHSLSGAVQLYVDGRLDAAGAIAYNRLLTGFTTIGAGYGNGIERGDFFNGSLDEVAVFDRPLTASEIYSHYVSGAPATGYAAAVLRDVPAAYWRLGEPGGAVALDSSGRGNAGTYSGGLVLGAAGAIAGDADTAAGLDGWADWIGVPRLGLPNGLTFEAWVSTTDWRSTSGYPGNAANTILGDHAGSVWLGFGVHGGRVRYNHYGAGWQSVTGSTAVSNFAWHHVAVTHSPTGEVAVYVDGRLDAAGSIPYSGAYAAVTTVGGGYADGVRRGDLFNGVLDEVVVFDRALSAAQIAAHYAVGTGS